MPTLRGEPAKSTSTFPAGGFVPWNLADGSGIAGTGDCIVLSGLAGWEQQCDAKQ
jgi:hypothetical protein